jgi:NAD(P)-dependent dehydrogenase (short-subunit alcohol dehydrogenase family)
VTINAGAAFGFVKAPELSAYSAINAGAARLTEQLAVDLPESVARFILIHSGLVKTDMYVKSGL